MLFEAGLDQAAIKKEFGDVLGVVEAWCKKNDTKLMIREFWPGEHKKNLKKFGLAGFDFIRPESLSASDIGELVLAVGVKYLVDTRVLRIHIAKRPDDNVW